MNTKYVTGGLLILLICLLITACPDNYTGSYYEITWGHCDRQDFEPIWQNPELSYAETKTALTAESGTSVKVREGVKETALQNRLDADVRLREDFIQDMLQNLAARPDAVRSWCRSDNPDTCYWVYVKKI